VRNTIFVVQVRVQHFRIIRIDGHAHAEIEQLFERMFFDALD